MAAHAAFIGIFPKKSERLIKQGEQATNMYFPVGQSLCAGVQAYFYPPVPSGKFSLWQHRAIASASLRNEYLYAPLFPAPDPGKGMALP